jgi:hypothetical protein
MGAHNGGRHALLTEAQTAVSLEIARAEALIPRGISQRVEAALNEPLPCKIETLGEALRRNRYALKKSATRKRSP